MRLIFGSITAWPRRIKKAIIIVLDFVLIGLALWVALSLRLGEFYSELPRNAHIFLGVSFFTVLIFSWLGVYRAVTRYIGQTLIKKILVGIFISSCLVLALSLYEWPTGLPRSVFAIYALVAFALMSAVRLIIRLTFIGTLDKHGQPVAIYGAGSSGRQLAAMLHAGSEFRLMAFIDDKEELDEQDINGVRVLGSASGALEEKLKELKVVSIFLAIPSASRQQRRQVLRRIEMFGIRVYTIPGVEEITSGSAAIDQLREVAIEDVLGRDAVPPVNSLLGICINRKVVMVTGAGGSIGTELCRQVLMLNPIKLICCDNSELALYNLERKITQLGMSKGLNVPTVSYVLAQVFDTGAMKGVVRAHQVNTIYHAAAYKHVPIVESNPLTGIFNNVFGTKVIAETAMLYGVEHFVLISTDKAVRPTNVMGASKRLAELVLQSLAVESSTIFSMVRFGNVLGSSGSVVPHFREQISNGGPVTVTHPEINRFFMTIAEAVQLVIQAGALAKGGEVFVLDMGEPVKILDLARQMIRLSGLEIRDVDNPDGDIAISYTGLRPGEKLYEELLIGDNVTGTIHPKIMCAEEESMAKNILDEILQQLEAVIAENNHVTAQEILQKVVSGYTPYKDDFDVGSSPSSLSYTSKPH